jgi:hypothetical protein
MFIPVRTKDDILGTDGMYWSRFEWELSHNNVFFKEKGIEILHNIQSSKSSQKLKRLLDPVQSTTLCKASEEKTKSKNNDECDFDVSELDDLVPESYTDGDTSNGYVGTHKVITGRSQIKNDRTIKAPLTEASIFENNDDTDDDNAEAQAPTSTQAAINLDSFHTIIEVVKGAILHGATDQHNIVSQETEGTSVEEDTLKSLSAAARDANLDEKQHQAFQTICCTFMLSSLQELYVKEAHRTACGVASAGVGGQVLHDYDAVIELLMKHGAMNSLFMFLSGAGGSGKSHVIHTARNFCSDFCRKSGLPFEKDSIYLTAVSGSAAALLGGGTLHAAAGLNKTRLPQELIAHWDIVRVLIIDEISYFSESDFVNLDKKLRRLKCVPDKMYGGVPIIVAGDFHQMCPVSGQPVYKSGWSEYWHGAVNCCIFLKNDHRFKDDPLFGQILSRLRMGKLTKEDIRRINERWLGNDGVDVPTTGDVCYACPLNKDRNTVSTKVFAGMIESTHPSLHDTGLTPPLHTLVIECSMKKGTNKPSDLFRNTVIDNCGDADIVTGHNKKIDPALKFYNGIPLMINSIDDIDKGRANGTICKGISVKLRSGTKLVPKIWDGRIINTVSVDDVEYIICQHYENTLATSKLFKLFPEPNSVKINLKLLGNIVTIGGIHITQFPVNSNIATTGHKLQGMTKDSRIVHSWN